jgi:hypothetical protein
MTNEQEIDRAERAHDFAAAWYELLEAMPDTEQVRVTWRKKRGQWLASVGSANATGTTEAEALRGVAQTLSKRKR